MRRFLLVIAALVVGLFSLPWSQGQTPAPVIIQAATPAPSVAAQAPAAVPQAEGNAIMQSLQEILATNAATIKKQEAALATLDELQKAAEELKIFSKRG